jgi:hypothetical protein
VKAIDNNGKGYIWEKVKRNEEIHSRFIVHLHTFH